MVSSHFSAAKGLLSTGINRRITIFLVSTVLFLLCLSLFIPAGYSLKHHLPFKYGSRPRDRSRGDWSHRGQGLSLPSEETRSRYETIEVWRSDDTVPSKFEDPRYHSQRPFQLPLNEFDELSGYLQQTIVADFPSSAVEDIFFMLKTGATVSWDRLPIHLFTTLTRVKKFGIYSDSPGSIGGYEIIDALSDLPQDIKEHQQLELHRILEQVRLDGYGLDVSQLAIENKGWDLDKFKNIPMLAHAYQSSPESKWFVFADGDTYVFWNNLDKFLSTLDHTQPWYLGTKAPFGNPHVSEFVHSFAHGGSGVAISKGTMDRIFGPGAKRSPQEIIDYYSRHTVNDCCGDAMVAWLVYEDGETLFTDDENMPWQRFHGDNMNDLPFSNVTWCEPIMSLHHLLPREIELLWEYERLKGPGTPILHSDLYHDMMQPYLVEEQPNWRLHLHDVEYKTDDQLPNKAQEDLVYYPATSAALCQRACLDDESCMAWYHYTGTCRLQQNKFTRGAGCNEHSKEWPGAKPTSGWMIERIQTWRNSAACDSTEDSNHSEGWFAKAKKQVNNHGDDRGGDHREKQDWDHHEER